MKITLHSTYKYIHI